MNQHIYTNISWQLSVYIYSELLEVTSTQNIMKFRNKSMVTENRYIQKFPIVSCVEVTKPDKFNKIALNKTIHTHIMYMCDIHNSNKIVLQL